VVRHDIDAEQAGIPALHRGDPPEVDIAIVDAWNQRTPEPDARAGGVKHVEIFQNAHVRHAGEGGMPHGIGRLVIEKEEIDVGQDFAITTGRGHPAGLEGGMNPDALCLAGDLAGEFGLGHRFAAGDGDASTGCGIEVGVFFYLGNDLLHCHGPALDLEAVLAACINATSARGAMPTVDGIAFGSDFMDAGRTDARAFAAVHALPRVEHEHGIARLRLGVVTPDAGERAAFQKDGGADAGSVVKRAAEDIEDDAGFQ